MEAGQDPFVARKAQLHDVPIFFQFYYNRRIFLPLIPKLRAYLYRLRNADQPSAGEALLKATRMYQISRFEKSALSFFSLPLIFRRPTLCDRNLQLLGACIATEFEKSIYTFM